MSMTKAELLISHDGAQRSVEAQTKLIAELDRQIKAMEKELQLLRRLHKYANHQPTCALGRIHINRVPFNKCTCGLWEIKKELENL